MTDARDHLVLPLDVPDLQTARARARALAPWYAIAKVGYELWAGAGPATLDALHEDGLVTSVAATKTGRGRRPLVYSLTPRADTLFPKAYGELTNELLDYVADTDRDLVGDLFARRRDNRVAAARARLEPKRTLGARVAELTRILDEDGYLADVERLDDGGWRITEHNCAILSVASGFRQACSSEIAFIRDALPGARVERVAHLMDGAHVCAYEVRPAGAGAGGPRRGAPAG